MSHQKGQEMPWQGSYWSTWDLNILKKTHINDNGLYYIEKKNHWVHSNTQKQKGHKGKLFVVEKH